MRRWRRAVIQRGDDYDTIYGCFRWKLPERFNIGVAACDRLADCSGRLALVYEAPDGSIERFSYDDLKRLSNRCANALAAAARRTSPTRRFRSIVPLLRRFIGYYSTPDS